MSPKRNKIKLPKCPCCNNEIHRTEMETVVKEMTKLDKANYKHYKELDIDSYYSFIDSNFKWACDNCLKSKKAILAGIGSQNYSFTPHFAYFDIKSNCFNCKNDFVFSKEEQRHWYESIKLYSYASPDNCFKCRQEIRKVKVQNKILSEILSKKESEFTKEDLEEIITIYKEWNKENKVNYYQSLLNKNWL